MRNLQKALSEALRHASFTNRFSERSVSPSKMRDLYKERRRFYYSVKDVESIKVRDVELDNLASCINKVLKAYISPKTGRLGSGISKLGNSPHLPSCKEYAKVLVLASARIGESRVIEMLEDWSQGMSMRVWDCLLIEGIKTEERIHIADGFYLEKLPSDMSRFPRSLYFHVYSYGPYSEETMSANEHSFRRDQFEESSVLCFEADAGPGLYHPDEYLGEEYKSLPTGWPDITRISKCNDSILCMAISLELNHPVRWRRQWDDYEDLYAFFLTSPGFVSGRKTSIDPRVNSSTSITREQLEKSKELHDLIANQNDLGKGFFRWSNSRISRLQEDQLIELRIAMEFVFLHNATGRGAIGNRVAVNGAWFLGGDFEERLDYFEALKKVYNLSSRVIHGTVLDRDKAGEYSETISKGQNLCRDAMIRITRQGGFPKWERLVLGEGDCT